MSIYIENEGALFKGRKVNIPNEVYSFKDGVWKTYKGEVPKPFDWGQEVDAKYVEQAIKDYRRARK